MTGWAINARQRQKAAVMATAAGVLSTPFRLNSLFDLFIQQLWNNIGNISGRLRLFTARDGGWHKLHAKAAHGLMRMGNKESSHRSSYGSTIQKRLTFNKTRTSVMRESAPTTALQAVADTAFR